MGRSPMGPELEPQKPHVHVLEQWLVKLAEVLQVGDGVVHPP